MPIIPPAELAFSFARSAAAGGQNVNKVETKAVLRWRVGRSRALTEEEKARVRAALANRLNKNDEIVIAVEEERSQAQNKERAVERLNDLVRRALMVPKKRRPTKPTRAGKERRLAGKKRKSLIKQARRVVEAGE